LVILTIIVAGRQDRASGNQFSFFEPVENPRLGGVADAGRPRQPRLWRQVQPVNDTNVVSCGPSRQNRVATDANECRRHV